MHKKISTNAGRHTLIKKQTTGSRNSMEQHATCAHHCRRKGTDREKRWLLSAFSLCTFFQGWFQRRCKLFALCIAALRYFMAVTV